MQKNSQTASEIVKEYQNRAITLLKAYIGSGIKADYNEYATCLRMMQHWSEIVALLSSGPSTLKGWAEFYPDDGWEGYYSDSSNSAE